SAFDNVTVFKNSATGNGGNIYNVPSATMTLANTVVGGGTGGTGADIDNAGSITSGDYNIIQTAPAGNALTGTTTHDLYTDPKLMPLSSNGGPTFTNADTSASPGRQHIPFSGSSCGSITIEQDQRGFNRGSGNLCDSGAYEYAGVATAIVHRPLPKRVWRHRLAHDVSIALPHVKRMEVNLKPF
ncbi:MAG TPA: choice-of-anchor Q domain-containing protein, partial [Candidatus Baltobacteraceae bacterium]|nr:choice-of-anchor Q domain-containing protein [Candidatus Baltobacteraceae bacterium]